MIETVPQRFQFTSALGMETHIEIAHLYPSHQRTKLGNLLAKAVNDQKSSPQCQKDSQTDHQQSRLFDCFYILHQTGTGDERRDRPARKRRSIAGEKVIGVVPRQLSDMLTQSLLYSMRYSLYRLSVAYIALERGDIDGLTICAINEKGGIALAGGVCDDLFNRVLGVNIQNNSSYCLECIDVYNSLSNRKDLAIPLGRWQNVCRQKQSAYRR